MKGKFAGLAGFAAVTLLAHGGVLAGNSNPIFQYNGNRFIIQSEQTDKVLQLHAYRAAGSAVWEPFGTAVIPLAEVKRRKAAIAGNPGSGSIVERIFFTGRRVGTSTVDLNDPLNTQLYRAPEGNDWD